MLISLELGGSVIFSACVTEFIPLINVFFTAKAEDTAHIPCIRTPIMRVIPSSNQNSDLDRAIYGPSNLS